MKTTKLLTAMMAIVFAVTILSCSKGDTGATGAMGTPGAPGAPGNNGVANLQVDTGTVFQTDWTQGSGNIWEAALTVNSLTQTIVNSGTIEVFEYYGGAAWSNLPYTYLINTTYFAYTSGNLVLFNANSDGSLPSQPSTTLFKIVLIPPAIMKKYPNTNFANASEVTKLPEVQAALNKKNSN
jgi:hypothetical protein